MSTEIVRFHSLNVNCTICVLGGQNRLFQDSFCVQIYFFCYLLVHCCQSLSWSLSSLLILINMPNFVTPSSSSYIRLLLFQIIYKYINQFWNCYRLPVLPEYYFQQYENSHHTLLVCFLMDSHIWRTFFLLSLQCVSPEYVSQGIFCKFLSRVIWECPTSKEVWAFLFCRQVCHKRPTPRCTKHLNV